MSPQSPRLVCLHTTIFKSYAHAIMFTPLCIQHISHRIYVRSTHQHKLGSVLMLRYIASGVLVLPRNVCLGLSSSQRSHDETSACRITLASNVAGDLHSVVLSNMFTIQYCCWYSHVILFQHIYDGMLGVDMDNDGKFRPMTAQHSTTILLSAGVLRK